MNGWQAVWGLTAVATIVVASACSSKSGGSCDFVCAADSPMTEMQNGNQACQQCTASSCSSQASTAYGSNWQSGNICAGECGSYIACIAACTCTDTACFTACSASSACTSASQAALSCQQQNCATQCGNSSTSSSSGGQTSSSSGGQTSSSSGSGIGTGTVTDGVCDGVAGSSGCPTASLVGCCIVSPAEVCFYSPMYTATTAMDGCSAESGTFQTSP